MTICMSNNPVQLNLTNIKHRLLGTISNLNIKVMIVGITCDMAFTQEYFYKNLKHELPHPLKLKHSSIDIYMYLQKTSSTMSFDAHMYKNTTSCTQHEQHHNSPGIPLPLPVPTGYHGETLHNCPALPRTIHMYLRNLPTTSLLLTETDTDHAERIL